MEFVFIAVLVGMLSLSFKDPAPLWKLDFKGIHQQGVPQLSLTVKKHSHSSVQ